jgi:hypothetical protein
LYIDGLEAEWALHPKAAFISPDGHGGQVVSYGKRTTAALRIMDMQLDNYCESAFFPVVLHTFGSSERKKASLKKKRRKRIEKSHQKLLASKGHSDRKQEEDDSAWHDSIDKKDELHFFEFTMAQVVPDGYEVEIFEYIGLRMLELKVAVDSSTIQLYLLDIHPDIVGESWEYTLAMERPGQWMEQYTQKMLTHTESLKLDEAELSKFKKPKVMHFEQIVLHPLKIKLSYCQSPFPRSKQDDIFSGSSAMIVAMKFARSAVSLDDFSIKINSFVVSDVMESPESLVGVVVEYYVGDILRQLHWIVGSLFGSMKILGKPAGLSRNIGDGVKAFFYEPYEGLMHSPDQFIFGVGRGTGSLISHVSAGVVSSLGTVLESATKGVAKGASLISGDEKYAKKMEEKRRLNAQSTGGVVHGIKAGGESVFEGFKSGISGLVTKPYEEGKKSGAIGFVKGIGLGALGVITKPVMGVTDGIANVAHGITNQVADVLVVENARPPRVLERSAVDFSLLVLTPLDLTGAIAQDFVMKHKDTPRGDAFVAAIAVERVLDQQGNRSHDVVVALTERKAYLLNSDFQRRMHLDWSFVYGEISHCILHREAHTVEAVVYKGSSGRTGYQIPCKNDDVSDRLYKLFWAVRHRMGNPSSMLPPVVALSDEVDDEDDVRNSFDEEEMDKLAELKNTNRNRKLSVVRHNSITIDPTIGLDGYKFGAANMKKFPTASYSAKELLQVQSERFQALNSGAQIARNPEEGEIVGTATWSDAVNKSHSEDQRQLDESLWQMVSDFSSSHSGMNSCRCCLFAIINRSTTPVQILRTEMMEGRSVHILGVGGRNGYDPESRSIMPNGGVAVIFAYGYRPSLVDKAHVKVCVFTSAFTANVATRKDRTNCEAVGGCCAGFLEKSLSQWWCKYVLVAV